MEKLTQDCWIVLGLVVALVAAAVIGIYMPQSSRLDELQTKIASLKQSLEADRRKAGVVPSLVREIEAMKSRYKDFDRRLPQHKELHGFLGEIANNLAKSNLFDRKIESGSPTEEELYQTLPIKMYCRGSYLSLAGFLQDISKMQRLTRVHTLQIDTDTKDRNLKIEMQLNIYFTES